MSKSNTKKLDMTSSLEDQDLSNIDKDLKDLINENESLKKGISKIFKEIEKKNKTN